MEAFKAMTDGELLGILEIFNIWWDFEDIPQAELRARVVLIWKKGDTAQYLNYRPISLLNSVYKIYAGMV